MKKLFALAALVLGLASCQKDTAGLDVIVDGEQETTISVSLPEATRANSAVGAFENFDLENSDLTIRYILQVYYEGQPSRERLVKYSDDKSVAFNVRLVPGRDYNFVVWADLVRGNDFVENVWSNDDGLHYNTTDLHNITLKQTWVAMDETRDAFTGKHYEESYSSASNITISLVRPFAKLRVITTDMKQLNDLGIAPTRATVEYTVDHYNAFNALAGEAIGDSKNRNIKHEDFEIKDYDDNVNDKSKVLFTDYFFANNDVVKFTMNIMEANGQSIKVNNFNTDINVKRNHLTTITGNILTDGNDIKVDVEDDFEGNENWPDNNAEQLAYAAMFGGVVELDGDIDLTNSASNIVFINDATIKLNGHTIKAGKWATGAFDISALIVDKGATLTIEGEGTIQGSQYGIYAYDGNLIIKGGNIKANTSAVQVREANVNIEGGVFSVTNSVNDTTYVINCIDRCYKDGSANVNITGGVFDGFNPGNNAAEGVNTNFVADGYKAIEANGLYYVLPEVIADAAETAGVTSVTESTTDVATALATDNGEATMFMWNDVAYIAKYGEVLITSAAAEATTSRGVVEYSTGLTSATVAEGIEVVGDRTFRRCANLETVALPNTLTEIGPAVFQSCSKLANITIPESVTTLGEGVFAECTALTSINIPYGVTRLEKDVLRNTGLVSVEIPASVNYIGTYAFRDCESLTEVKILSPEFTIENNTFTNMAAPVPTMTIYVVNAEMKAYLDSTLSNYDKSYITVVGPTKVSTADELKAAIINGGNIEFANDITVDEWIMFSEDLNVATGDIITVENINVSIDGKGHTLTVNAIESAGNNDQLFQGASVLNISNLTIKYADGLTSGGLGMDSGVIKNVHFVGGGSAASSAAIFPKQGEILVEDCIFDTNGVAFYNDDECDNLTVTRCTFNQKDNKNVILLRGDVKFTDNIINTGRTVNVVSGSPVVTGNNFNNVRLKVYGAATATISNNIINKLEFDGTTYASTFSGNTLSAEAQAALNAVTKVN